MTSVRVDDALSEIVQLARRSREVSSLEELGFVMVNETIKLLHYRQAALWTGQSNGKIQAVSGLPAPNSSAPYSQWLSLLCERLASEPTQNVIQVTSSDFLEWQDDWFSWLPKFVLWIPVKHVVLGNMGGLVLASESPWSSREVAIADEMSGIYGQSLSTFVSRPSTTRWMSQLTTRRSFKTWSAALILAILIFPVPQSILAPAEVIPKDPYVVRAPIDGVVDRMLVVPNQRVELGVPLFSLDQTALRSRNAVAKKALEAAQEEYRQTAQLAVTEDKGKGELAQRRGVLEEKVVEHAYSEELLKRIHVEAERSGIAVYSDPNDLQGKAVQMGERILVLADPRRVELSIQLPVGEVFDAKPGGLVSLYPNASPLNAFEAKITQVAYSAEPTRDGQLAYHLKAAFTGPDEPPRIGLIGTAKLHGSLAPLSYYILRRPLTVLRQWTGK